MDYSKFTIAVIGDVMLDEWHEVDKARMSPEAPVPVMENPQIIRSLGGAGNVAVNIAALGAQCILFGIAGADPAGQALHMLLAETSRVRDMVHTAGDRHTTVKSRYAVRGQHVVRVDIEDKYNISVANGHRLIQCLQAYQSELSGVIIADYDKGLCSPTVIAGTMESETLAELPLLVDPKIRHFRQYARLSRRGDVIFKPNEAEVKAARLHWAMPVDVLDMASRLATEHSLGTHVVITMGADGMSIASLTGETFHIPARFVDVYNVCGAGDTVAAVLLLEYLRTEGDIREAVEVANVAASLVVQKPRTGTVTVEELEEVI